MTKSGCTLLDIFYLRIAISLKIRTLLLEAKAQIKLNISIIAQ